MAKVTGFLHGNHRGSSKLTVPIVLGVLDVLNGRNVHNVLNVLNMPMGASSANWALFFYHLLTKTLK